MSLDMSKWADVVPVPQDDGPQPVAAIAYKPEFVILMDLFRGVISVGELSDRVLDLTKQILSVNPANYTVWQYRRSCLLALGKDLREELDYMDSFSRDNPKNYQIWHHRRVIAENTRDGQRELDFTSAVFAVDSKNYHAWAHRQWVLSEFKLFPGELAYLDGLLQLDIRNNSAWNQRWFVVQNSEAGNRDVLNREIEFSFGQIALAPDNESAWNYLRGLALSPSSFTVDMAVLQELKERLVFLCQSFDESKGNTRHLYSLTADICERIGAVSDVEFATTLFVRLCGLDAIRTKYWQLRMDRLRSTVLPQSLKQEGCV